MQWGVTFGSREPGLDFETEFVCWVREHRGFHRERNVCALTAIVGSVWLLSRFHVRIYRVV